MDARERAELVKAACLDDWLSKPKDKTVLEKIKNNLRLVVRQAPELILNKQGEVVGVDAWVQLFDENSRELKIDPHRRIINPPTVPRSGVREVDTGQLDGLGRPVKQRILTADPLAAFYEAVWDSVAGTPNPQGWRTRGTVDTFFSGTNDGEIDSTSNVYATARTGGTLTVDLDTTANMIVGQYFSSPNYHSIEGFVSFDTSAIADTDTVSAVTLDLYIGTNNSTDGFTLEARERDWGATLTTADWVSGASLSALTLMASKATSGITAGAYNTLTSQAAFLTATNLKTGTVFLILDSSRHIAGNTPTGFTEYVIIKPADTVGTTQDPKLTVTHAASPSPPMFTSQPNRIWTVM